MYNNGNSSKNVTGASVVDGSLDSADFPDNGLSGNKIDGGTISNFTSTGIDDNATSTQLTVSDISVDVTGYVTCDNKTVIEGVDTGNPINTVTDSLRVSGYGIQANRGAMFLTNAATDGLIHMGNSGAHNSNILASFTSNGLTFNGDTAAANALDDYEEGTFTPYFGCDSSNPTISYSSQVGNYTKIGDTVHFKIRVTTSSVSGGSGTLRIYGLPYSAQSATTNVAAAVSFGFIYNWTNNPNMMNIGAGLNSILVYKDVYTNTTASAGDLKSGMYCLISGTYHTS